MQRLILDWALDQNFLLFAVIQIVLIGTIETNVNKVGRLDGILFTCIS